MINIKDLRIGNFVLATYPYETEKITEVESIGFDGINLFVHGDIIEPNCHYYSNISPIPLSNDWLEKFSVESYREDKGWTGTIFHLHKGDLINKMPACWVKPDAHGNFLFYYGGLVNGVKIEYVHRLQNLYHDLVGKELKIIDHATTK